MNPFQVVRVFETALCKYTGAPYAVATNSCTNAILLAVRYHTLKAYREKTAGIGGTKPPIIPRQLIEIPKRTYISVPMSIIHAGAWPTFRDEEWIGAYQLNPLPVWDSARWFSSGMYGERWIANHDADGEVIEKRRFCWAEEHAMVCVSFHADATLGIEQGGAILHDNPEADEWFRRARHDGRLEGLPLLADTIDMVGYHCRLNPSTAAQGILRLNILQRHNDPLPTPDYPDLSTLRVFQ